MLTETEQAAEDFYYLWFTNDFKVGSKGLHKYSHKQLVNMERLFFAALRAR